MKLKPLSENEVTKRLKLSDGLRRSPAHYGGEASHKEWLHYCIFATTECGEKIDIIINFSLTDGVQTLAGNGIEVPRLTILICKSGVWFGAMERYDWHQIDIESGRIDMLYHRSYVRFENSVYQVKAQTETGDLDLDLTFTANSSPVNTPSIGIDKGFIRWLCVPQMHAEGSCAISGKRYLINTSPAYHDHNWGQFCWGDDFSWQWGVILGEGNDDGMSIVVSRILDKSAQKVYSQSVMVCWHGNMRDFRGSEVTIERSGLLHKAPKIRLPGILNLASQRKYSDLAEHYVIKAKNSRDYIDIHFDSIDYGQIGLPNDVPGSGITVLTEAICSAKAVGMIGQHKFSIRGTCLWEETSAA